MSDILRQLHEDHKKRMSKLWQQSKPVILRSPPKTEQSEKPPEPWEKCIALIARTYERKVGRSKRMTTPITAEEILSASQNLAIVRARDVAIYLTRRAANTSTTGLGKSFNRSRATVLHSLAKVQALVDRSPTVKEEIEKLLAQVRPEVICAEEASAAADQRQ